jgi:hypothetical protein
VTDARLARLTSGLPASPHPDRVVPLAHQPSTARIHASF